MKILVSWIAVLVLFCGLLLPPAQAATGTFDFDISKGPYAYIDNLTVPGVGEFEFFDLFSLKQNYGTPAEVAVGYPPNGAFGLGTVDASPFILNGFEAQLLLPMNGMNLSVVGFLDTNPVFQNSQVFPFGSDLSYSSNSIIVNAIFVYTYNDWDSNLTSPFLVKELKVSSVPLPGSWFLLGSGLAGFVGIIRRRKP